MGITGPLLALLKDYLSDRTPRVVLDDHYLHYVIVTSGVPQGSVLGPISFLAFIDDIIYKPDHSKIVLFADDTKIFMKIDNNDELQKLQQDIDYLCDWSEKWSFPFNCKFLPIKVNTEDDFLFIKEGLSRVKLTKSSNEKDLVIIIDDNLSFKCHINTVDIFSYKVPDIHTL